VSIARDQDTALVTVSDSGIGIPIDKRASIFEMFAQVDRVLNRPQAGLGIGLHLVKRLVEMHGGAIAVDSDGPGRGSRFIVRLPALPASTTIDVPHAALPPPPPRPAHRRRILVVDDNVDNAESLFYLLEMEGHEVHIAHDGRKAVTESERLRPDAVLLDLGLPIVDGFDACRTIRAQPWGRQILLIAITGWGQDIDRRRSAEAGFDHHLVKPVDVRAITKILTDAPLHVSQ
jgi:CheY-like chemotaxis protein